MKTLTDQLNYLVADFVRARDKDGSFAGADEAYKLAEFCAQIFEKPFIVRTEDGEREIQLPHRSSADLYRETWRKEGRNVSHQTARLLVFLSDPRWFAGEKTK